MKRVIYNKYRLFMTSLRVTLIGFQVLLHIVFNNYAPRILPVLMSKCVGERPLASYTDFDNGTGDREINRSISSDVKLVPFSRLNIRCETCTLQSFEHQM